MLARVSRAAWRLEQAEQERMWALGSARAEGISIRTLATAIGLSPSRIHQLVADADWGAEKNGAGNRVRPSSLLNTASRGRDHAYGPLLAVPERVVRLIGGIIGFAAPVAFSGEQVPGALGLG